jgi:hypothetical protein
MRRAFVIAIAGFMLTPIFSATAATTVTGINGQSISVSSTSVRSGDVLRVKGKGFDETVGIYLAFCVIPKKGQPPTPCGGGVNKLGEGDASYWISSNPPAYGVGLAIPFSAGGRFSETVTISRKIGTFDCTKVKCAITVRSDHLHEGDRTHDLFIPIKIKR